MTWNARGHMTLRVKMTINKTEVGKDIVFFVFYPVYAVFGENQDS